MGHHVMAMRKGKSGIERGTRETGTSTRKTGRGIGLKAIFQAGVIATYNFRLPSVITISSSSSCRIQHIHIRKQTVYQTQ